MSTNNESLVLASINGRSQLEINQAITFHLVTRVAEQLTFLETQKMDSPLQAILGFQLEAYIKEMREHFDTAKDFDEVITWLPSDYRIFQTRAEQAMTGENENIYLFLEIPVQGFAEDLKIPAKIAILITAKHLIVNVTPEQSQDYVTLRYANRVLTPDEVKLLRRLEALDRFSQLKLWERGYPVHAGYNNELDHMPKIVYKGCEDAGIRYVLKYTTQQDWTSLTRQAPVEMEVEGLVFNSRAGRCLPDHTCCTQGGMWSDEVRREFMTKSPRERDIAQQRNLFDRMKHLHGTLGQVGG